MEADGEWHTSDNKYGSTQWRAKHPVACGSTLPASQKSSSVSTRSPPKLANGHSDGGAKGNDGEVFVLDSDDEDEGQVKRELSPSFGSGSSANQSFGGSAAYVPQTQTQPEDVIDLTLDSGEDEPPLPKQAGKRKATDANIISPSPTEQIWKKSRLDADRVLPPPPSARGSSGVAGTIDYHPLHAIPSRSATLSSPLQYPISYHGAPVSPSYPSPTYGGSPTGNTQTTTLPGINSILPRATGRWP